MIVKIERADGEIEIFNTDNYRISKSKEFHPLICKVSVYDNGKKIKVVKRPFKFIYKYFIFKSKTVQDKLKEIFEQNQEKGGEK